MSDLRQAAEQAIETFLDQFADAVQTLRQALAHEAMDRMVAENQKLGLYDEDNLQTAIEKGTKAWADVPNAGEWVEELRGNDTPEETPEVTPEVPCKTDPRAPHGFDRNASHSADRYVCECESWTPEVTGEVDAVNMSQDRVDETAKGKYKACYEIPDWRPGMVFPAPKREWVGLTDEEFEKILETHNEAMPFAIYLNIEQALKEKNT